MTRSGPLLTLAASCSGCRHIDPRYYRACAHPDVVAATGFSRALAVDWATPEWCVELPAARERMAEELVGASAETTPDPDAGKRASPRACLEIQRRASR